MVERANHISHMTFVEWYNYNWEWADIRVWVQEPLGFDKTPLKWFKHEIGLKLGGLFLKVEECILLLFGTSWMRSIARGNQRYNHQGRNHVTGPNRNEEMMHVRRWTVRVTTKLLLVWTILSTHHTTPNQNQLKVNILVCNLRGNRWDLAKQCCHFHHLYFELGP